jgi:GT2 family glycosyltransferase
VIAVDTGSTDRTSELLTEALISTNAGGRPVDGDGVLDGVLTLDRDTGFGDAVRAAVASAVDRWGDPGQWLWLLHDDCAPEPDCLGLLLTLSDVSPSVAMLGPLALDWADPRLVVEAGLSTDASGHRQTGVGPVEADRTGGPDGSVGLYEQSTEVLAVPSAGALIRRDVWDELGGYDPALPVLRDDLDFGWRVNRSGRVVLSVPSARIRHARAATLGLRPLAAAPVPPGPSTRAVDRAHGLRTVLVNSGTFAFLVGLPRLTGLTVLRALGFVLLRRWGQAGAELRALAYLLRGRGALRAARSARAGIGPAGQVRGLLTTRTTRLRNLVRGGVAGWVRRRVAADAALGRLPDTDQRATWVVPDETAPGRRAVGPAALPAGALGTRASRAAGLRRPAVAVAVPIAPPVPTLDTDARRPSPRPRPSPVPRGQPTPGRVLVLVEVSRWRLVRQVLFAPPVLLVLGLTLVSLVTNAGRLGLDLSGGGLLPVQGLGATWSSYLAAWHAVSGGTAAPPPAALAVLGILGAVCAPFGGPPAAAAVLLLGDAPLAGLLGYAATRRMAVRRPVRALVAAGYALLPPATAAVAQGRLDVVVVHLLLPPVLVGVVAVLNPSTRGNTATSWLSAAAFSVLGVALIGAFAPLVQAVVIVFALAGFVAVPGQPGDGRRRVAALFAIVLVPLALLVPWPAVVLSHPVVLLSGVAAQGVTPTVGLAGLLALDPGGPGAWLPAGLAVLIGTAVTLVLRPRRAMLPGFGVVGLGAGAVAVVAMVPAVPLTGVVAQRFWAGAPMLVVGAGLLWALLAASRPDPRGAPKRSAIVRLLAVVGVLAVLTLTAGDLLAGRAGPLRAGGGDALAGPLQAELAGTGRSVLVLGANGAPTRQSADRPPAFGDDDIAPVPGAPARFARWDSQLLSGNSTAVRDAVAQAVAAGVLFVVLPDQAAATGVRAAAGNLVAPVTATDTGRPVLRLQLAGGSAALISTDLAKQAVSGGTPPTTLGAVGVTPLTVTPPDVALRVSEGAPNRLLVLSAEDEPGWQATLDGQPAPIVPAWGHLVAVTIPLDGADVRIAQPDALREVLLLVQAAVLLFTALSAIPSRRRAA